MPTQFFQKVFPCHVNVLFQAHLLLIASFLAPAPRALRVGRLLLARAPRWGAVPGGGARRGDLGGAAGCGWTVESPGNSSLDALPASVPGQVHLDLLRTGVLPLDLYMGFEDWGQAWVGQSAWTYRRSFDHPGCPAEAATCGATL